MEYTVGMDKPKTKTDVIEELMRSVRGRGGLRPDEIELLLHKAFDGGQEYSAAMRRLRDTEDYY